MMKYWMFQNNQVRGPYDADDISQVPGFSGDALVCSDGRKGTSMGDWQRASMVPELSVSLLKASQLAVSMKGGSGSAFYSSLPPEPTLKDLAALGSLQEKVSLLDNSVTQLQDNLRLKETELLSLHRELDDKSRQAQELALKLGTVEERLSAVGTLQEGLDKTTAAEHDLEATIQRQSQTIEELTQKIQTLQQDSADLKAKEEELEKLQKQLEERGNRPSAGSMPSPGPSPFGPREGLSPSPGSSPFGSREGLQPAAGEKLMPVMAPAPAIQPPSFESRPMPLLGEAPTPSPSLDFNLGPSSPPLSMAPPSAQLGGNPFSSPPSQPASLPFSPLSAPPPSSFGPTPTAAATPAPDLSVPQILSSEPPKKGGSGALMILLLLAGGIGVGVKLKLIPINKILKMLPLSGMKKGGASTEAPLPPPPAPEAMPKTPSPEELAEQAKKEAIDLVRNWPLEGGLKTVGQVLEAESPPAGGLPPWMAEKIQDDMYQVNFYAKSPAGTKTYEFEASMGDKKVLAHNEPAAALLTPGKPKKKGKGGKKTAAAKGEDAHMLEDLLQNPGDNDATSAGAPISADQAADDGGQPASPAKKKKKEPKRDVNKDLDDLMGDEPAPAPAKAAPKKDESLDQLLVPGASGKPDLQEPQAAGNGAPTPAASDDDSAAPAPAPAAKPPKKGSGKPADAELLDDLLNP